ncbi:MAG: type II toxin-antitoxin system VapC family toxin [Coraliomargarita sp.]|nr:type II toxin-antitoxin system VapC family toxin [Coraliomargarita sp.]
MGRGVKAVFDTNILIDFLNGVEAAAKEIALYDDRAISVITQMEILVGVDGAEEERVVRRFLSGFKLKELTATVADQAVRLRRELRLKVPDAIVYATAREAGCIIVTRNTKDFKRHWPDVREPYSL